jgi:hypothetical protein
MKSLKLFHLSTFIALSISTSIAADATNNEATSNISITNGVDLIEARINGLPLKDLTLGKVTDLFGRPDAVSDPVKHQHSSGLSFTGARLYYHEKGLTFDFRHPEQDQEQHLKNVVIHLSKVWDSDFTTFFQPFSGNLSRNVNCNWKSSKVMATFSDLNPEDYWEKNRAQREGVKSAEEKSKALGMDLRNANSALFEQIDASIVVKLNSHYLRFAYEKNTKFVEEITIIFAD